MTSDLRTSQISPIWAAGSSNRMGGRSPIASKQGARSFERRAMMSLTRLLAKQDRRDEARAMLAEIYGWFTEGFDAADLRNAKRLPDELSPAAM